VGISWLFITSIDLHSFVNWQNRQILFGPLQEPFAIDCQLTILDNSAFDDCSSLEPL
jgi:hypothetical protein